MAEIKEITGNIFDSKCQTIVNTVNCMGVMGKGIALEYKKRFPQMYEQYKQFCDNGDIKPGYLWLWTKSTPWVLNFPTKQHWRYPSRIEYIEIGMKKFSEKYKKKNIVSIAFPEIGASLGGLRWEDVKKVMYKYLEPLQDLKVEIYHFDPKQ